MGRWEVMGGERRVYEEVPEVSPPLSSCRVSKESSFTTHSSSMVAKTRKNAAVVAKPVADEEELTEEVGPPTALSRDRPHVC